MLDLIKNSSADSQQLLSQVNLPSLFDMKKNALFVDSRQIIPVPVVMHEVKKYCRTL